MDDLKKACLIVLENNPGQYIQCILEYEDVYEFTMVDNGKEPNGLIMFDTFPAVEKGTLKYLGRLEAFDQHFKGDYKKLDIPDIEEIDFFKIIGFKKPNNI